MAAFSHQPVLIAEVLGVLQPVSSGVYLDCTVGLGGHTEAILCQSAPAGRVIGIDRDKEALCLARERLLAYQDRLTLKHGSFLEMLPILESLNVKEVNGVVFDLGVSSYQLENPERGFSFQMPGPLDMRMDQRLKRTAADMVNTLREKELANILYQFGEERGARKIASFIIHHREHKGKFTQTTELADLVCRAVRQKSKWTRTHPATKTFQALRIAVNNEMGELDAGLSSAVSMLAIGGRLAVISFHSLEDRPVKTRFKALSHLPGKPYINIYKKPVVPTREEITRNPKARSAKLRALVRVA